MVSGGQTTRRAYTMNPRKTSHGRLRYDGLSLRCLLHPKAEPVADIPAEVVIAGTAFWATGRANVSGTKPRGRGHCGGR
jgi:hypothetical protein